MQTCFERDTVIIELFIDPFDEWHMCVKYLLFITVNLLLSPYSLLLEYFSFNMQSKKYVSL